MSYIQWKTQFYSRIKDVFIYKVMSLFLLIGGVYEYSLSIQWNSDIFLDKIAGAHLLSFIAILVIVLMFGYKDIIRGMLFGGAFVAAHELIWTLSFFIAGTPLVGNTPVEVIGVYYGAYVLLLSSIILTLISFFGRGSLWLYEKVSLVMVIFDVVWLFLGFKTSVSLLGQTIYYLNPTVNAVESLGWCIPAAWLIVEYLVTRRQAPSMDVL